MPSAKGQGRRAFSIVEMLVALALTIFIMSILSVAFVEGLTAFRRLKTITDLDQQLKSAANLLRRDLRAHHFEGDKRLSTLVDPYTGTFQPPELGFFSYGEGFDPQTGRPTIPEGTDGSNTLNRPSERDVNDFLHLTVRKDGNSRDDFFYGPVPAQLDSLGLAASRYDSTGGLYTSQWSEVVYFVRPMSLSGVPLTTGAPPGGATPIQRHNLYRRQLLITPEYLTASSALVEKPKFFPYPLPDRPNEYDLSCRPYFYTPTAPLADQAPPDAAANTPWVLPPPAGHVNFQPNSPADVQYLEWRYGVRWIQSNQTPSNRILWWDYKPVAGRREGADLLLTNVLSFDIKVYDPNAVVVGPNSGSPTVRGEFVDLGHRGTYAGYPNGGNNWFWRASPNEALNTGSLPGVPAPLFAGAGNNPSVGLTDQTSTPLPNAPKNVLVYDTWAARNNALWADQDGQLYNYGNQAAAAANKYRIPYPSSIRALQIKLRIWDPKTEQAREVTIIQEM